jgi:four helix bundle protein
MSSHPHEFSHERLYVYQAAIEFLALIIPLSADLPRGYAPLGDQLRRAAQSIPLNIAEACGRTGAADAARHYAIARGSALESAAAMDVMRVAGVVKAEQLDHAREVLVRVVRMLSKMSR